MNQLDGFKKLISLGMGITGIIISGAAAVATGNPLAIQALYIVVPAIAGLAGLNIGGQSYVDATKAKTATTDSPK